MRTLFLGAIGLGIMMYLAQVAQELAKIAHALEGYRTRTLNAKLLEEIRNGE